MHLTPRLLFEDVAERLAGTGFVPARRGSSLVWRPGDWRFEVDFTADAEAESYRSVDVDFGAFNAKVGRFAKKFGSPQLSGNALVGIDLGTWNLALTRRWSLAHRRAVEVLRADARVGFEQTGLRGEALEAALGRWAEQNLRPAKEVPAAIAAALTEQVLPVCELLQEPRALLTMASESDYPWLSFRAAANLFACELGEEAAREYVAAVRARLPDAPRPRVPWM